MDAVNRIPLVSTFLEVVGLVRAHPSVRLPYVAECLGLVLLLAVLKGL